jgi:hypothetical protein
MRDSCQANVQNCLIAFDGMRADSNAEQNQRWQQVLQFLQQSLSVVLSVLFVSAGS